MSNSVFRYFEPIKSAKADGLVAHVYTQVKKDMGCEVLSVASTSPAK